MQAQKTNAVFYAKRVASGIAASLIITFFIMAMGGSTLFGELLLYETLPNYRYNPETIHNGLMAMLPSWNSRDNAAAVNNPVFVGYTGDDVSEAAEVSDIADVFASPESGLIGIGDVAFHYREQNTANNDNAIAAGAFLLPPFAPRTVTPYIYDSLWNFTYLRNNYFSIEPDTDLLPRHIDFSRFFNPEIRLNQPDDPSKPTVLIFHVHSAEYFVDTDPADPWTGIMGVGAYLQQVLAGYGIVALHETSRFDIVNGNVQWFGVYERMEPAIRRILDENPTIQIVIDLHRDGILGDRKFLTYIDGIPTAQIMYVNGLSLRGERGTRNNLRELTNLHNPYLMENLIFSLNMQLMKNELFPGLSRRTLLKPFRYSTHMRPLSLLVEVGNQNNTQQEARNAMHLFARTLAHVVLD